MKYLSLAVALAAVLAFSSTASVRADSYDSETATVQKSTDKTAKVMIDKGTYMTPVTFDDGADWSSVKDHYELDPAAAAGVKSGKMAIAVGSDGTLSFKPCKMSCSSSKK